MPLLGREPANTPISSDLFLCPAVPSHSRMECVSSFFPLLLLLLTLCLLRLLCLLARWLALPACLLALSESLITARAFSFQPIPNFEQLQHSVVNSDELNRTRCRKILLHSAKKKVAIIWRERRISASTFTKHTFGSSAVRDHCQGSSLSGLHSSRVITGLLIRACTQTHTIMHTFHKHSASENASKSSALAPIPYA